MSKRSSPIAPPLGAGNIQPAGSAVGAHVAVISESYNRHVRSTAALPQISFPRLRIFRETELGRVRLDDDPLHTRLRTQVLAAFAHLVGSDTAKNYLRIILNTIWRDAAAREAVKANHDMDRPPSEDEITSFLIDHTPTIVLNPLVTEKPGEVAWGRVLKGTAPGAKENEIFLLEELGDTYSDSPPADLSPSAVTIAKQCQDIMVFATLLYGTVHAITKYFYSAELSTPLLGILVSDGQGNGEAGWSFEREYLRFCVQAVWPKRIVSSPDKMWRISKIVVAATHSRKIWVLADADLTRLLESFGTTAIWHLPGAALQVYHCEPSEVRYRVGLSQPMMDEEEAEEGEETVLDDNSEVVFQRCARGVGFKGLGFPTFD